MTDISPNLCAEQIQNQITQQNFEKIFEIFIDSFSGATGGFCASLILYPIENIRTRLQAL